MNLSVVRKEKNGPLYYLVVLRFNQNAYNIFTNQQKSANVSLPQHDGLVIMINISKAFIGWTKLTLFLVMRSFKKLLIMIREMGFRSLFLRSAITNLSVYLKHFNLHVDTLTIAKSNLSGT